MPRRTLLIAALVAVPAFAQTPVDQLAQPPADAKVWTITRNGGVERHGQVALWTDASGTHWSRFSLNMHSFVVEVDQQNRFAPDGTLESMVIRGRTPQGNAAETYQAKNGTYTWTSPVDHGSGKARPNLDYVAFGGTLDSLLFIIDAMLKPEDSRSTAWVGDGAGKTLIPGMWDNHQHYGDDSTGPLLLASGITSVRDPGNLPVESMARKKRIDHGELLGPRIVPSLLIDGPGPNAAEVGVVAHSLDEALADVRRAKNEGYFAIKLYNSLDHAWAKPMADLAHELGLHVHGHIPHGMRPLDAVRAGYDEITHIASLMMQVVPDDVVATSNSMARTIATCKYTAGVDLHSKMMTDYLDELAYRHIAVDPTLVIFEKIYVSDSGTYPAADAPYVETLPAQFARSFLSVFAKPDLPTALMRASFDKLKALIGELNKRHVTILAGTDGTGFEVIRELELYVEAGLTPADALATVTINPAKEYHLADQTGSIVKGKLAELALIDGDPSKNIGDLRQVELVMRDGKMMDAQALRESVGISGPPKR